MQFGTIQYAFQGDFNAAVPRMVKVRQIFSDEKLVDPAGKTIEELTRVIPQRLDGQRIALTAGSRRISHLPEILKAAGCYLRSRGAEPFTVPAMGSHGGATAEGQLLMLTNLGITEESIGMPILSDMEADAVGTVAGGCTIYCNRPVLKADGVIVCGRIKPHTSIRGKVGSGLCKMMVVGLGKHKGAATFHRMGYSRLAQVLPAGAELFLQRVNVLCGLGIVENAFDETYRIEAVPPQGLIERESKLLQLAESLMPRFLMDTIDVLVVDQIGKDISGAGMDPNITGRSITPLPARAPVPIRTIVALGVSEASHGNATGIGGADLTSRRVVESIDWGATYTNILTSGALRAAAMPITLNTDREAICAAVCTTPGKQPNEVKVAHIWDTLHMSEIEVSSNYFPLAENADRIQLLQEPGLMAFDSEGRLLSSW